MFSEISLRVLKLGEVSAGVTLGHGVMIRVSRQPPTEWSPAVAMCTFFGRDLLRTTGSTRQSARKWNFWLLLSKSKSLKSICAGSGLICRVLRKPAHETNFCWLYWISGRSKGISGKNSSLKSQPCRSCALILGLKQQKKTPFHRETFSRCFEHANESQCLMNVSSTAPKQGLRKACSGKNVVAIWGRLPSNEIPKEMRPIHSWRRIPGWNEPMLGLPFLAFLAFLAIMYLSGWFWGATIVFLLHHGQMQREKIGCAGRTFCLRCPRSTDGIRWSLGWVSQIRKLVKTYDTGTTKRNM